MTTPRNTFKPLVETDGTTPIHAVNAELYIDSNYNKVYYKDSGGVVYVVAENSEIVTTIPNELLSPGLNEGDYLLAGKYHCNNPVIFDMGTGTPIGETSFLNDLNFPIYAVGLLEVIRLGTVTPTIYQKYTTRDTNQIFIRARNHLLTWTNWTEK